MLQVRSLPVQRDRAAEGGWAVNSRQTIFTLLFCAGLSMFSTPQAIVATKGSTNIPPVFVPIGATLMLLAWGCVGVSMLATKPTDKIGI